MPKSVSEKLKRLLPCHFTSVPILEGETGNIRPTMVGTSRGSTQSRALKSSTENSPIRKPNQMLRKDKTRDSSLIRIFSVNIKFLLGFGIIAFAIALFFINSLIKSIEKPQKPRVITPLPASKLMDLLMRRA
ncbi:hypothetical protein P3S68_021470 [Capsicum galapagoense]